MEFVTQLPLSLILPLAGVLIAIWPAMRVRHPLGIFFAMVAGASAGLLVVLGYWATGKTHPNAIAGLVQWNDAAGYLACAQQLILNAVLYPLCSMRPYYVAEFGTLLAASGGNVQVALLLQAAVVGAAAGWFAREVSYRGGIIAGLATFLVLLVFIAQFALPVLTENSGLLLGLLSIAIIWTRSNSIRPFHFLAAMMLLTLALNARAGAMLILPALLIWSVALSEGDPRQRMIRSLYGFFGIVAAAIIHLGLAHLFGGGIARSHSNFAYTFYAMTVNKATYLQIFIDHPEVRNLPATELTKAIYDFAWVNLRLRPELFVLGYLSGGVRWIYGWFEFVPVFHLRAVFFVAALIGLWSCLKNWRGERERLLLIMFAAIGISSPFLFYFGGSRIFAATFPVDALMVAYGVAHVAGRCFIPAEMGAAKRNSLGIAVAVMIAWAPLPVALLLRAKPILSPVAADVDCPTGQDSFVADLGREATVVSLGDRKDVSLFPLVVDQDSFVKRIHPATHRLDELRELKAGTTLFGAVQRLPTGAGALRYGENIQFLWHGPFPRGLVKGCVDRSPQHWLPIGTSLTPLR